MRQMDEQMPGFLEKIDDPWGITWRVANAIKRASLRRTVRFIKGYISSIHYERPVFVIGVPRSGTTMLFHLLRESSQLGALPREGHDLWRTFHHPRSNSWRSDVVKKGEVCFGERRFVNAYLYSYFSSERFVEKTPENCLRIPYLLDLFPDAFFVVVKRNPCDVINSHINGWRHSKGRYRSYFVPTDLRIPGYPRRRQWCFALIEGWRDYVSSPIPEIAFAQWEQCTKAIVAARAPVPRSNWIEVYFEHLLASPDETVSCICECIGIQFGSSLRKKLAELLAEPVNALSAPGIEKWRRENKKEITELLPKIAPSAPEAGYIIDVNTGELEIRH